MIVQRDKILQIYDNFKDLFQTYFGGDRIDFKHISTQMLSNIDDWKLFFKVINLIIEKENIDHNNKSGLLNIIFNKAIINLRPEEIFSKISTWVKQKQNTLYYYSHEQYTKDMENLLVLISGFVDNYDIEISIIKKENLKLFFKEEIIYKKGIIKILSTKNNILEQIKTKEEFNNIFSLISKIRNAIKGKTKKSNDETTNLISNIFWNNDLTNEKERKSFLKLYVDFSKTLFNFLINNSDLI